jgi:AbrB family looped-hinge helix DNA binding protein
MSFATISSKGQITLPARSRKALGLKPHDRVSVDVKNDAIVIRPVGDFFELEGFLGKRFSDKQERTSVIEAAIRHAEGEE